MATSSRALFGVSAAVLTVSLAACSSSSSSGSSTSPTASSTPSTAASTPSTTDYVSVLISASDIPVPGVKEGTPAAPPQGSGAVVAFTATGGRSVGDTVLVLPDAATAQAAAAQSVTAAKQELSGAKASDAPIGDGGTAIRGTAKSGAAAGGAVTVLIFSEGKALVVLQFVSKANDPVPTAVVQAVATAQDDKIKAASIG